MLLILVLEFDSKNQFIYFVGTTLINQMKEIKEKEENKDISFKFRMSKTDAKNLKKIAKVLKVNDSETIRLLIESKVKELSKQKNLFE